MSTLPKKILKEEQLLPVKTYWLCKSIQNSKFTMVKLYKCSQLLNLKLYYFLCIIDQFFSELFYCFLHSCPVLVIYFFMLPACSVKLMVLLPATESTTREQRSSILILSFMTQLTSASLCQFWFPTCCLFLPRWGFFLFLYFFTLLNCIFLLSTHCSSLPPSESASCTPQKTLTDLKRLCLWKFLDCTFSLNDGCRGRASVR